MEAVSCSFQLLLKYKQHFGVLHCCSTKGAGTEQREGRPRILDSKILRAERDLADQLIPSQIPSSLSTIL